MVWAVLAVVASYLVGTFPTGLLVGRRSGHDPTAEGSHNPGATNVYRVAGRRAGVVVLVGDLVKGVVPTAVGLAVGGRPLGLACGLAAVVGHVAPVTRRFRGGKGVATAAGMALVLYPALSLAVAAVFGAALVLSRRMSVASLAMAVALPIGVAVTGRPWWEVVGVIALSSCVIARHRGNIARLREGTEPRLRGASTSKGQT